MDNGVEIRIGVSVVVVSLGGVMLLLGEWLVVVIVVWCVGMWVSCLIE